MNDVTAQRVMMKEAAAQRVIEESNTETDTPTAAEPVTMTEMFSYLMGQYSVPMMADYSKAASQQSHKTKTRRSNSQPTISHVREPHNH